MRLRRWLLGGAVVLLATLAGLIGFARHRARSALLNLPHLLGADIKSETDGFTYSQTVKGRTLFTIHAAKAIQHRDGKTTLRNVSVTLYGEPGTNRVDRIRGAEFEYDQANGIVRALGESEIDLASPAQEHVEQPGAKHIHAKTSGLVLNQKLGTAITQEAIHFEYGNVRGSAIGANFDAHTGLLYLQHNVQVRNEESAQVQKIDADSATLDRQGRTAQLTGATVAQASDLLHAQQLLIQLRQENVTGKNSIETIHGSGGVELRTGDGNVATAPVLEASVSTDNHLQQAHLSGGVLMRNPGGEGHSGTATLVFDRQGRASRVELRQTVQLQQKADTGATRQLNGDAVEGTLMSDAAGHTVLQQSVATGHAILRMTDMATGKVPAKETILAADTLRTFGGAANGRWQVRHVIGDGATRVEEREQGVEDRVSTAIHLELFLTPFETAHSAQVDAIESFLQHGHVHAVDRQPAVNGKAAVESVADAENAEYAANSGKVVLTGSPTVRNNEVEVSALRITVARTTGDAEAIGAVKGTYQPQPGATRTSTDNGPLHFLADRTVMHRSAKQATFFGEQRPVRLWRDGAQIEAPFIEVDQLKGELFARNLPNGHLAAPVRTILPSETPQAPAMPVADTHKAGVVRPHSPGPVRVTSQTLQYRQAANHVPATADFNGNVRFDTASGQVLCDHATAVLQDSGKTAAKGLLGGSLETMTAESRVRITQPGRTANGSRLVYTAASQLFTLTGQPGVLPSVHDSVQGTVTGTTLLFHAGDDSVDVTGAADQPVRTELDAPPRHGAGPGKATGSFSGSADQKK